MVRGVVESLRGEEAGTDRKVCVRLLTGAGVCGIFLVEVNAKSRWILQQSGRQTQFSLFLGLALLISFSDTSDGGGACWVWQLTGLYLPFSMVSPYRNKGHSAEIKFGSVCVRDGPGGVWALDATLPCAEGSNYS